MSFHSFDSSFLINNMTEQNCGLLQNHPFKYNFVWHETGANGNCQFSSLAASMLPPFEGITADEVRRKVADQVFNLTPQQLTRELAQYREEGITGKWDPKTCYSAEGLRSAILRPIVTGNYWGFQGDDLTLMLWTMAYKHSIILVYMPEGTITKLGDYDPCVLLLCKTSQDLDSKKVSTPTNSTFAGELEKALNAKRHYQSLCVYFGSNWVQSYFPSTPKWLSDLIAEEDKRHK